MGRVYEERFSCSRMNRVMVEARVVIDHVEVSSWGIITMGVEGP